MKINEILDKNLALLAIYDFNLNDILDQLIFYYDSMKIYERARPGTKAPTIFDLAESSIDAGTKILQVKFIVDTDLEEKLTEIQQYLNLIENMRKILT